MTLEVKIPIIKNDVPKDMTQHFYKLLTYEV